MMSIRDTNLSKPLLPLSTEELWLLQTCASGPEPCALVSAEVLLRIVYQVCNQSKAIETLQSAIENPSAGSILKYGRESQLLEALFKSKDILEGKDI